MRITIIILGIIGLLLLGLSWDKSSSNSQIIPIKESALHSNDNINKLYNKGKTSLCPNCNKGDEIVQVSGIPIQNTCKTHQTIAINL